MKKSFFAIKKLSILFFLCIIFGHNSNYSIQKDHENPDNTYENLERYDSDIDNNNVTNLEDWESDIDNNNRIPIDEIDSHNHDSGPDDSENNSLKSFRTAKNGNDDHYNKKNSSNIDEDRLLRTKEFQKFLSGEDFETTSRDSDKDDDNDEYLEEQTKFINNIRACRQKRKYKKQLRLLTYSSFFICIFSLIYLFILIRKNKKKKEEKEEQQEIEHKHKVKNYENLKNKKIKYIYSG